MKKRVAFIDKIRIKISEAIYPGHLKIRKMHDVVYSKGGTYKGWSDKRYSSAVHKTVLVSFITSFAIFAFAQGIFPNVFNLWKDSPVLAGSIERVWNTLADFTNNTGLTGNTTLNNIDLNNGDPRLSTTASSTQDTSFSDFGKTGNALIGNTISLGPETVTIGTQTWMKYNLNVGTMLASGATNPTNNGVVEKWCHGNSTANCTAYGGLYSWDEMMGYTTTPGIQGICPTGFKIPTDSEWYTLESYLATGTCLATRSGHGCDPAGTALKPGGSSGFEGLLAGNRHPNGTFFSLGTVGFYWSSHENTDSTASAFARVLNSSNSTVQRSSFEKAGGFPVRCLRN